jgi:integrase
MAARTKNLLPFNSEAVKAAKPRAGKLTEYKIATVPGLTLVVQPTGVATYFVRYFVRQGEQKRWRREKIGRRELVSLADARKQALELMTKVAGGADPVAENEARRQALTFRQLFALRVEKDDKRSRRTLDDYRKCLEADVFPAIGDIPADELTADQIAKVLEGLESRSKHTAHKARSAIGSTYRFAVKRRLAQRNPTIGLGFTVQSDPRKRVLSDDELAKLWTGLIPGNGLSEPMQIIFKLAVLTGQRESEVAGARVDELRLDGPAPRWVIAGTATRKGRKVEGRMKSKREQAVPLSRQAAELFKRAIEINGGSEWCFPADRQRTRADKEPRTPHIHGQSVSHAMSKLRDRIGLDDARVHDLRKTLTTWLGEQGERPDVLDKILHHSPKGVTAAFYNFSQMDALVRGALQRWADHVWEITGKAEPRGNVLALRA